MALALEGLQLRSRRVAACVLQLLSVCVARTCLFGRMDFVLIGRAAGFLHGPVVPSARVDMAIEN